MKDDYEGVSAILTNGDVVKCDYFEFSVAHIG